MTATLAAALVSTFAAIPATMTGNSSGKFHNESQNIGVHVYTHPLFSIPFP
jgi:hypothetical protein